MDDNWLSAFLLGMVLGASTVLALAHMFLPDIIQELVVTAPHLKVD